MMLCDPGRGVRFCLCAVLLAAPSIGVAQQSDEGSGRIHAGAVFDLRAISAGDEVGWLDEGLGKLRYGAGTAGERSSALRLSNISLFATARLTDDLSAHAQVNVDADPRGGIKGSRLGLIEAYAAWRRVLTPGFRVKTRGGMFFPPLSLENTDPGWTSPYTITPSAINAWIGEEVRTVGIEGSAVGTVGAGELTLTGSVFGFNDPAGTLLAWRGWALHDRLTAVSDELPLPPLPAFGPHGVFPLQDAYTCPLCEVDGRAGWYAAVSYRRYPRLQIGAFFYDNRGDPTRVDRGQYSWNTRFSQLGIRLALPAQGTLLSQILSGHTLMGKRITVYAPFAAGYVLASWPLGQRHRFSMRWDHFDVRDEDNGGSRDPNSENGSAWTLAYRVRTGERHHVAVEVLRESSRRPARALIGEPERAVEVLLQAAFRVKW